MLSALKQMMMKFGCGWLIVLASFAISDGWAQSGSGSISGRINFKGVAPKLRPLAMDADPVCAAKQTKPVYPEVVSTNPNGTLRNVFVYVKKGLEGKTYPAPKQPVTLDQNGCVYKPHVLGIQAGQPLKIVSSDKTAHNIHPLPRSNAEWNISQQAGAGPITKTFTKPEVSIPVICNQHPWMKAYLHVVSHPYYAVTGPDGSFELKGLPAGKYEIETVHERFGALSQQAIVVSGKPASLQFTYTAKQAYRPSSLTAVPALMLP